MSPRLAAAVGYDPNALAGLPPGQGRALAAVALCAMPGVVLTGLGAGSGAYLASDQWPLAIAVGVSGALYLANLLRLSIAGGGVAPHQPAAELRAWAPRVVPLLMLAAIGAFAAQPLLVLALRERQDPEIAALRASLTRLHARSVAGPLRAELALRDDLERDLQRRQTLAATHLQAVEADAARVPSRLQDALLASARAELTARDAEVTAAHAQREALQGELAGLERGELAVYAAALERSHFLLRRLELCWAQPGLAASLTFLLMVLLVLPWVASGLAVRAQRAYELRRWAATRALIEVAAERTDALVDAALKAWPGYRGPRTPLFQDPPYNTRRRRPRHG